ncbi:MFS transporter [Listeria ilorinensis]|uniref:MFS transporter n=1 Tax=Listeria ilorinensis TaxID=2867439 RepID=UPI001EF4FC7A|nr:MFS transporter [Listeria ilorinensis]
MQLLKNHFTPLTYFYFFLSFLVNFFRFMTIPFLTIYLTNKVALPPEQVGLIIGLPALIQLIFSLFLSNIADRISFKQAISISLILPALGLIGYITAVTLPFLLIASIISGIGWSIYNPLLMAALSQATKDTDLDAAMNINYWLVNLGGVLGPVVGALLGGGSSKLPFILFSLVLFLVALSVLLFFPKKLTSSESIKESSSIFYRFKTLFFDKKALSLFFAFFCIFFIEAQYETSFALYLNDYFHADGAKIIAAMLTTMTLSIIIGQPLLTMILKKVANTTIFFAGTVIYILAILLFFQGKSISAFLFAAIFFAVGELLIAPKLQVQTAKIAPQNSQTTYFAFVTMGGNLAYFIGPTIGNYFVSSNITILIVLLITTTICLFLLAITKK